MQILQNTYKVDQFGDAIMEVVGVITLNEVEAGGYTSDDTDPYDFIESLEEAMEYELMSRADEAELRDCGWF